MTLDQVQDLLKIIRLNYPQSFTKFTKEQSEAYLAMWCEAFKDDPVDLVVAAVKAIIYSDAREFAPNIGQIKQKMQSISSPNELTEQEAWNIVKKAIGRSGWYAKEEFEALPPTLQRLVGSPEQLHDWSQTDSDDLNTVVASNFMRSYRARSSQEKEFQMLPNEIKTMIGTISTKMIGTSDEI